MHGAATVETPSGGRQIEFLPLQPSPSHVPVSTSRWAPAARAPLWLRAQEPAGAARAAGRRSAEPGFREGGDRRFGAGQARAKPSDWSDQGAGLGGGLGPDSTRSQSRAPPPHLVDFVKHIYQKLARSAQAAPNGIIIKHPHKSIISYSFSRYRQRMHYWSSELHPCCNC